jgi:Uma2 family endonuclease
MAAATIPDVAVPEESFVPVEVYLSTMYHPDCDYVDGKLLERNVGEIPHSTVQNFFGWFLRNREDEWQFRALPEQRVQVSAKNYRIADVTILPVPSPDKRIVRSAPTVCIEVLSPEDRMSAIQEKVDEFLQMGVQAVWIIDPLRRKAYVVEPGKGMAAAQPVLTVEGTPIAIPVADIFAELDRYGL